MALTMTFAVGGASAQTAAAASVGQPMPLLAGLRPPHETQHALRAKPEHRSVRKVAAAEHTRHIAEHTRHAGAKRTAKREHERRLHHVTQHRIAASPPFAAPPTPPQTALSFAPTESPPAAPATAPNDASAVSTPAIAPPADSETSTIAITGESVQMKQPDQINSLDRAATQTPGSSSAPTPTIQPDTATAAPQTVLAAPAQAEKSGDADSVGGASWLAQVLAALGGAVAAGAVAWILIGSGPMRTYG